MERKGSSMFATKIGAILAAAGSAVGLGNIWRFPTETGTNGGAAFILIYVLFMILFGVPIMVTEFAVGRYGNKDVTHSFLTMSDGKKWWKYMGLMPVVAGFLVLSYYAVVAGWTLYYAVVAALDGFSGKEPHEYSEFFSSFASDEVKPIVWLVVVVMFTAAIVALGVRRGIERGARIMMPLLFVFIVVLVVCSMTLPGASQGVDFLLRPDFSKVNGATVLSAMGQAFFSLSVGICCLCTYACYFRKDVNLIHDGLSVAIIDTLVALMAGFIIFPAVYSIPGLSPDAGPSLVFVTLPNVFQHAFGDVVWLSYIFSVLFYLLLVMAALTSSISMLEMIVAFFHEEYRASRPLVAVLSSVACICLGALCSLSFGSLSDVTLFGMTIFDFCDFLVAKLLMPAGSLLICVFAGWVVKRDNMYAELTNGGVVNRYVFPVYYAIIRYVAPIGILLIFFNGLGLV